MAIRKKSRPSGSTTSGSGSSTRGGYVGDRQPSGRSGSAGPTVPGYNGLFGWSPTDIDVRSGIDPENRWWSVNEGNNTARLIDSLLGSLSQSGNLGENYSSLLLQLASIYQDPTTPVDPNLVASIFTSLLGYAHTQDQRQYDWAMLQDSRLYNNPTNELARLMGAGISRDAALQILSGGSAGSAGVGAGTAAPVASPVAGAGAAALNGSNAHANQMNNIYGGINTAVSALATLTQTGISVAEAVPQIQMMQAQNYMTQKQLSSFQDVDNVAQMIQSLQNVGHLDKAEIDKISNGNDLVDYLQKVAPDNDWVNHLVKSAPYQRMLGSQFGRQQFNNWWKSIRDTRDEGTLRDEFIRQQQLDNVVRELQPDLIGAELENIGADTEGKYQSIRESCYRVALIDTEIYVKTTEGKWIAKQTERYDDIVNADIALKRSQASLNSAQEDYTRTLDFGQDIQNQQLSQDFELSKEGFPILKQCYVNELQHTLAYWNTINNPEMRATEIQKWCQDVRNARYAAYLQKIQQQAVGSFAIENPQIWKLSCGFQYAGVNDFVSTSAEGAGAAVETGAVIGKYLFKAIPK